MRYRLRTLLILVTVAAVCFGWIAHLRRMADLHRKEAARLILLLSAAENVSPRKVEKDLAFVVSGGSSPIVTHRDDPSLIAVENGKKGRDVRAETADDWKAACDHQIIANKYDRAIFRPWELIRANAAP